MFIEYIYFAIYFFFFYSNSVDYVGSKSNHDTVKVNHKPDSAHEVSPKSAPSNPEIIQSKNQTLVSASLVVHVSYILIAFTVTLIDSVIYF